MAEIRLDHAVVPSRDRKTGAQLLAEILDVQWSAETSVGPFSPVYVNDDLTLDFAQAEGPFPLLHFCFRVDEAEFDAILARIQEKGIAFRSRPMGKADMQINTRDGGRSVYWNEPDDHIWEILTASYARRPVT